MSEQPAEYTVSNELNEDSVSGIKSDSLVLNLESTNTFTDTISKIFQNNAPDSSTMPLTAISGSNIVGPTSAASFIASTITNTVGLNYSYPTTNIYSINDPYIIDKPITENRAKELFSIASKYDFKELLVTTSGNIVLSDRDIIYVYIVNKKQWVVITKENVELYSTVPEPLVMVILRYDGLISVVSKEDNVIFNIDNRYVML
jgi:hypothetical protein